MSMDSQWITFRGLRIRMVMCHFLHGTTNEINHTLGTRLLPQYDELEDKPKWIMQNDVLPCLITCDIFRTVDYLGV